MFSREDVRKQLSVLGYRDVPDEILEKFVDRLRNAQALQQKDETRHDEPFYEQSFDDDVVPPPEDSTQSHKTQRNTKPKRQIAPPRITRVAAKPTAAKKRAQTSNNENERRHPNTQESMLDLREQRRQSQRLQLAEALAEKKRLLKQLHAQRSSSPARQNISNHAATDDEYETSEFETSGAQDSPDQSEDSNQEEPEVKAVVNRPLRVSSTNRLYGREASYSNRPSVRRPVSARPISRSGSTPGLRVRPSTARRKVKPGQLARKSDPVSRFHQYNAAWKKSSFLRR
jgi:hypothetical protein